MQCRTVRYDDMYRMDEIKSISFHSRLFRGVAKYIVYGNYLGDCNLYTPPTTGREGETERARTKPGARY